MFVFLILNFSTLLRYPELMLLYSKLARKMPNIQYRVHRTLSFYPNSNAMVSRVSSKRGLKIESGRKLFP